MLHNVEAEQAVLGAIMVNNEVFDRVADRLSPAHFYDPVHARIFEVCGELIQSDKRATSVTLKAYFENDDSLSDIGGASYLSRMAGACVSVVDAMACAETVRDAAERRRIMAILDEAKARLERPRTGDTPQKVAEYAESELMGVSGQTERPSNVSFAAAAATALQEMNEAFHSDGAVSGVPTGLRDMDHATGGWRPGLIILAARPSMGKSALALHFAKAAADSGRPVAFVSLEMQESDLAARLMSRLSFDARPQTAYSDAIRGLASGQEYMRLAELVKANDRLPIDFLPPHVCTLAGIRSGIKKVKARHGGLGLIVVDYLQKIQHHPPGLNKTQAIGEVTGALKALAMELRVPVILLSQLNRGLEAREDKRPLMSDLRESGEIEQDADTILMMFREDYYLERAEPQEHTSEHVDWQVAMDKCRGLLEINIAKQRMGATGRRKFFFAPAYNAICDLAA